MLVTPLPAISLLTLDRISKTLRSGNLISCDPTTISLAFVHHKNFDQLSDGLSLMHARTMARFDSIIDKLVIVANADLAWHQEQLPWLRPITAERLSPGIAVSRALAEINLTYIFRPSLYKPWQPHLGISLPLFTIHERRVGATTADEYCYAGSSPLPITSLTSTIAKTFEGSCQWTHATLIETNPIECFMGIQLAHSNTATVSLCLPRIQLFFGKTNDDVATSLPMRAGIGGSLNGRLMLHEWSNSTLSLYAAVEHRFCPRQVIMHQIGIADESRKKQTPIFSTTTISHQLSEGLLLFHYATDGFFSTCGYRLALYTAPDPANHFATEHTILFDSGVVTKTGHLMAAVGTEFFFIPPHPVETPIKSISFKIGVQF